MLCSGQQSLFPWSWFGCLCLALPKVPAKVTCKRPITSGCTERCTSGASISWSSGEAGPKPVWLTAGPWRASSLQLFCSFACLTAMSWSAVKAAPSTVCYKLSAAILLRRLPNLHRQTLTGPKLQSSCLQTAHAWSVLDSNPLLLMKPCLLPAGHPLKSCAEAFLVVHQTRPAIISFDQPRLSHDVIEYTFQGRRSNMSNSSNSTVESWGWSPLTSNTYVNMHTLTDTCTHMASVPVAGWIDASPRAVLERCAGKHDDGLRELLGLTCREPTSAVFICEQHVLWDTMDQAGLALIQAQDHEWEVSPALSVSPFWVLLLLQRSLQYLHTPYNAQCAQAHFKMSLHRSIAHPVIGGLQSPSSACWSMQEAGGIRTLWVIQQSSAVLAAANIST